MTFHRLSLYRHIGGLPYRHTVGFWVAVAHAGTISDVLMPYRSDKERTRVYHRTLDTTEHTVISAAPILYRQGDSMNISMKTFPLSFCLGKGISYGYYACWSRLIYIKFQVAYGLQVVKQCEPVLCRKTKTSQRNTHKKP